MSLRLAIALLLSPLPAMAEGFLALDLPGSQLTALADDGRSAAGSLAGSAGGGFRWRQGHGAQTLPHAVSVRGISPSGRYVAGSSLDENADEVATWWDAAADAHRIAGLPGAHSIGRTIDDTGQLGGIAHDRDDRRIAFSWTAAGGLQAYESAPTSAPAGEAAQASSLSEPLTSAEENTVDSRVRAADIDEDVRTLPRCPGVAEGSAELPAPLEFVAASRDGALRVGHAGSSRQRRAVVWTAREGTQRLDVFLAAHGVEVPRDWTLVAATAVDADARRIGGYGLRQHRFDSFIAELPASVRILCDSSTPPTASQRRKPTDQSIPSQEITP
ncbi:hypothetical protein [Dokdonella sp.]|uniref:hypothetical protein n=1 Tax=Dokdonella sp. TaxID=2291710 RepID=UPI001B1E5319|nr:hypothetical protein [Dokdonella sp.]MBO9662164.1 hypothetical protein [Dokdonella sp.]